MFDCRAWTKQMLVGTTLALLGASSAPLHAQVTVTDTIVSTSTPRFNADINYPHTGIAAVDKLLDRSALAHPDEEDLEGATADRPYSNDFSYVVDRNDKKMLTVEINGSVYSGGAHGFPYFDIYNFLAPDYSQVFLPELVDGHLGLLRIGKLAKTDILAQLKQSHIPVTPNEMNIIDLNVSPEALYSANFQWQQSELVLEFGNYTINGYPRGPVVHIPLSELAGLIRKNPREPMPSFECAQARSSVERTICKSVDLSRLDRQVSARYIMALSSDRYGIEVANTAPMNPTRQQMLVENTGALSRLIASQKAWLAERDATCKPATVVCLTTSYQTRLHGGFHN